MHSIRCHAPMVSMEFTPLGDVQVCCMNGFHPLGNVTRQTLDEIWRGPAAQSLRAAVAAGDLTLGCTVCRRHVELGRAERAYETYDHHAVPDVPLDELWPQRLSFALHNTCNLACVMCGADRSSRIRRATPGMARLPHHYGNRFFEELPPYLAHADLVDFNGGEPFIIREHHRVWDLLEEVQPDARCSVTTNGTIWNDRVEHVLDAFPTDVRVSIDGITPATLEAIRVGADAAVVFENLARFGEYARRRSTWLGISWTLVRRNWFELGEMLLWAEDQGLPVTIQTVVDPRHGLQRCDDDELAAIHAALRSEHETLADRLVLNRQQWDRQLDMIAAEVDRRGRRVETEPYMEPPTPGVERRIAGLLLDIARTSPTTVSSPDDALAMMDRWPCVDERTVVELDLDGRIVAIGPPGVTGATGPRGSTGGTAAIDPGPGTDVVAWLERLSSGHGASPWIIDVVHDAGCVMVALFFGREHRDLTGTVLRIAARPTGAGVELVVDRDDTFADDGPSVGSVPVSLRGATR